MNFLKQFKKQKPATIKATGSNDVLYLEVKVETADYIRRVNEMSSRIRH